LAGHGIDCQTVEIDPVVVRVAREQFRFDGPATVADGRTFLDSTSQQWDLIFLDVCTSDRLAWHMFTVEAMQLIRDRLAPEGILVIQFIGDDGPWSASLARTAGAVFGESRVLAGGGNLARVGPRWLFASPGFLPPVADTPFLPEGPVPWETAPSATVGHLLTDDHFPVEVAWARTARYWRSLYASSELPDL
jgi:hypothetical protein